MPGVMIEKVERKYRAYAVYSARDTFLRLPYNALTRRTIIPINVFNRERRRQSSSSQVRTVNLFELGVNTILQGQNEMNIP